MNVLKELSASTPVALSISIMGIRGINLGVDGWLYSDEAHAYQRDDLHLPESMIYDYNKDHDYQEVIAEQMDFLWNAFGFERCVYFDRQGRLTHSL